MCNHMKSPNGNSSDIGPDGEKPAVCFAACLMWLLCPPQAAIGSQLMSVAGVFSHLPHSIDTLTSLSTVGHLLNMPSLLPAWTSHKRHCLEQIFLACRQTAAGDLQRCAYVGCLVFAGARQLVCGRRSCPSPAVCAAAAANRRRAGRRRGHGAILASAVWAPQFRCLSHHRCTSGTSEPAATKNMQSRV